MIVESLPRFEEKTDFSHSYCHNLHQIRNYSKVHRNKKKSAEWIISPHHLSQDSRCRACDITHGGAPERTMVLAVFPDEIRTKVPAIKGDKLSSSGYTPFWGEEKIGPLFLRGLLLREYVLAERDHCLSIFLAADLSWQ